MSAIQRLDFRYVAVLALILGVRGEAAARTIGPDAFGYLATDSVPFAFEDIAATGALSLARSDDGVFTAPIGFTFSFYGMSYDTASWSPNGLITLGGTNSQFNNIDLSRSRTIGDKPSIAVLWDDWQFTDARAEGVYFETRGAPGSRRFIIQWTKAFTVDSAVDSVTFQTILFERTNTILFEYLDVDAGDFQSFGAAATVGIRDTAGHTNGRNLLWSFNSSNIANGQAIRFGTTSDSSPPLVTIKSPGEGTVIGAAEVAVAADVADESESTVTSIPPGLNVSLPAGGGSVSGFVPLVEGPSTITVSATDVAGNVGGTSVTVVRDTTAPVISSITPADGTVFGESPVAFTIGVRDATQTTVTFGPNTDTLPPGGGTSADSVPLVEGNNLVSIVVTDAAGNSTSSSVNVVLDLTAAVVTINSPADGTCFGPDESQVPVVITVNDLTETTLVSTVSGLSSTLPPGGGILAGSMALTEGPNEISVTATDAAGRSSSASIAVFLDTKPPVVSIDSPGDGQVLRGTIDFSMTATDPLPGCGLSRVDLLVDGVFLASLESPPFEAVLDTTGLEDGVHTLTATALDMKGNSASSHLPAFVDNTPPRASVTDPPEGAQVSGLISFKAEASDGSGSGLVMLKVLANGVEPSLATTLVYDPPVSPGVLLGQEDTTRWPNGSLKLTAVAVDAAGNETVAAITVTVENSTSAAMILSPADGSVVSGVVPITVEVSGPGFEAIEVFVDEVPQGSSSTSPFTVSFDTASRLDGALLITGTVYYAGGRTISASSVVTVDNMSFRLTPVILNLASKCGGRVVAHVEGVSVQHLLPVEEHNIRLIIPGASPVPALRSMARDSSKVLICFDRARLIASIRASLAAGVIEADSAIEVALVAEGDALVGTASLRVHQKNER